MLTQWFGHLSHGPACASLCISVAHLRSAASEDTAVSTPGSAESRIFVQRCALGITLKGQQPLSGSGLSATLCIATRWSGTASATPKVLGNNQEPSGQGLRPEARRPHEAQDGCECGPTQNLWPRDTKRVDTPD
ncbi:hypothetical protein HJG60_010167 [Phyllostomus discolor]|uniref:Uncharacterized protein n=1 Tax=Phyllostomus discolor TaxID=89673 RepID=A0A834EJQ3_9CHIR|nr:hypothetical protein HJG60_010167 [Phyllostomus discolor]